MFSRRKSSLSTIIKAAIEEARLRGDRRMGTAHLLLGLLHHDESARALGIDVATARAALDDLDRAALRMLGLEVGDLAKTPRKHPRIPDTALTSGARAVLNQAIKATTAKTRDAEVPRHLTLGLLAQPQSDPAAQLLDQLQIDRATVRSRIA